MEEDTSSVSYKLTRINNAVDRIRVKTESSSDAVIEDVATAVEGLKNPSGSIPITSNGSVDVTNYVTANVNVQPIAEAKEKDINFYDYDGFRIASWSLSELSSKTSLPDNPREHSGLIFQEWNWTLAQLKTNNDKACVGALYKTDDNATRLYLRLPDNNNSIQLRLSASKSTTVKVNWGDGSAEYSYTTQSLIDGGEFFPQHTYVNAGDYKISIRIQNYEDGKYIGLCGNNASSGNKSNILGEITNVNYRQCNFIYRVELSGQFLNKLNACSFNRMYGLNFFICSTQADAPGAYTFYDCEGLESIILPQGSTSIGTYCFETCQALRIASIPYTVTQIKTDAFRKCYALRELTFPHNPSLTEIGSYASASCNVLSTVIIPKYVTTIGTYAYAYEYGIASITIPSSVTTIQANAFLNNYCLKEIHFKRSTPPTVEANTAFKNLPTTCKIYVPSSALSAYRSATNYPSSSSYTYIGE